MPDGWYECELGEIAKIVTDFVASGSFASLRENVKYYDSPNHAILVRTKDFSNNFEKDLVYTDKHGYTFLSNSNLYGGELILPNIGASIGKVFIMPKLEHLTTLAPNSIMVRCWDEITLKWLYYFFCSGIGQNALKEISSSTAQGKFNKTDFKGISIPIPPLKEQTKVIKLISFIEDILQLLESERSNLDKNITLAKAKILDLAMQGKLVPQDPADEPAADMLCRINPKAKIITDNPHYPQLPDNWVLVPLEDITEYEQPQPYIIQNTSYSDTDTIPVLTAGKSFILGYTNEDFGVYENVPAIIFDDFTTDSKLVEFHFKVKSSAMKIIQVKRGLSIEYVAMFMSITRLIGETHKRYWISEYSKILIPIPPLEEQNRIVEKVNSIYCELDKIISALSE